MSYIFSGSAIRTHSEVAEKMEEQKNAIIHSLTHKLKLMEEDKDAVTSKLKEEDAVIHSPNYYYSPFDLLHRSPFPFLAPCKPAS